jgi:C4-dicarboxylate-specific signal transduction histidine kinase
MVEVAGAVPRWLKYVAPNYVTVDTNVRTMDVVPIELCEIIHNLVRNAFEAHLEHGTPEPYVKVVISGDAALPLPSMTTVRVIDNAPGVPNEVLAALFAGRVVRRGSDLPTRGFGLSICRELAEDYDGGIQYHRKLGETVFTVTLLDTCVALA